jgi:hypothetical protein
MLANASKVSLCFGREREVGRPTTNAYINAVLFVNDGPSIIGPYYGHKAISFFTNNDKLIKAKDIEIINPYK